MRRVYVKTFDTDSQAVTPSQVGSPMEGQVSLKNANVVKKAIYVPHTNLVPNFGSGSILPSRFHSTTGVVEGSIVNPELGSTTKPIYSHPPSTRVE
jgi:hypothetical protein